MGAKDSKPCFITYEEAVKRVTESELKRIGEAFKKSAGAAGIPLSKNGFIQDVLGDGVPGVISDWIFAACGGTRRGIAFKDLLCGLVVLTKGSQEERIKFLWTLYCNETGTHIQKWDFIKALQAENASLHPPGVRPPCIASSEALTALFGRNGDKADFDQFRSWLLLRADATVLSRWILLEPRVRLTSDLETPTFYQTLAGVTHLEERDISALEKCFWSLQSRSPIGQLDMEVLSPLLSPPVPRAALQGLFLALDENRDGHVDFKELCCGLSAACRGPSCERMKFCFKVFDTDRDGFLNEAEVQQMCGILCSVATESLNNQGRSGVAGHRRLSSQEVPQHPDVVFDTLRKTIFADKGEIPRRKSREKTKRVSVERFHLGEKIKTDLNEDVKSSLALSSFVDSEAKTGDTPEKLETNVNISENTQIINSFLAEEKKDSLDSNEGSVKTKSGAVEMDEEWGLSQEEFLIWGVEKAENLVAPFLLLIYDVCHIVLGLRPQCKHQEHEIVLGWLAREVARGYSVGQFWYLVSSEWWSAWLAHTGAGDGPGKGVSCATCGHRPPPARTPPIDEAIVCDESFNSSESMGDLLVRAETVSMSSGSSSSGVSSSSGSRSARHPGPINNSHLLQPNPYKVRSLTGEGGHLRRDQMLAQHRDFELLPDSLWKALAQWYGGPQPLPRQVIQPPNSDVELELYPRNLRLLRHTPPGPQTNSGPSSSWSGMVGGYGAAALSSVGMASYQSTTPVQPVRYLAYTAAFSRLATIRQVCDFICCQLGLAREDVRLWLVAARGGVGELLEEEGTTLSQLGAEDGQRLLVEVRNKDLTWPEELGALSLSAVTEGRGSVVSGMVGGVASYPHPDGATGLHNLGNTCFMNAALQAVWNTGPLTRYFTRGMHLYELNTENPHGTGGALAQRYGELCKEVWLSGARSVAPLRVRWCVWRHAARFSGGGQHDSQELLAWLLDALHEDLNRSPRGLPYRELGDSNGRPDQEVALEAWEHHTARNQSIITELFYGQLKSKVTCASCGHESVRFDAFNMLSLPLPMESYNLVEVLVILLDGSIPVKYGVRLNSDARYWQLKQQLSTLCGLPPPSLLLVPRLLPGSVWPSRLPHNTARVGLHAQLCAYHVPPGVQHARQHAPVSEGDKGVAAPAAERSSISSEYGDSPTTNHFLNAKNIKSLENNNGSSGYNSIQELDHHREQENCTPPNYLSPDYYSHSSPRKAGDPKRHQEDLRNIPLKGSPTLSVKSFENSSPNMKKKQFDINCKPMQGGEILAQPTNARVMRTNSPLLTARKNPHADTNKNMNNSPTLSARKLSLENKDFSGMKGDEDVSSTSSMTGVKCEEDFIPNYLIAVHRKQSRQESYFLSQQKRRWETFGSPLVIPISEGCGGRELYAAVWRQVERLLSAPPPQPPDQANHATDCDDSLGYSFPFTLRVVGQKGLRCAVCPWTSFCRGCALPCTDDPLIINLYPNGSPAEQRYFPAPQPSELDSSQESDTCREPTLVRLDMEELRMAGMAEDLHLAVDWEPTALHLRYQSNRDAMFTEHESVRECRNGQAAPVQLQHCLHSFTSEECLEERYSCSACRSHQPATKKLQIWRLPPVLVIHLKRFQYVNKKWIKSHKAVNFPYEDFDPTAFLASVPQETILRHNDILLHRANKLMKRTPQLLSNSSSAEVIESTSEGLETNQTSVELSDLKKNSKESPLKMNSLSRESSDLDRSKIGSVLEDLKEEGDDLKGSDDSLRTSILEKIKLEKSGRKGSVVVSTRERLVSTSLSKTPVMDDEFVDFHQHKLKAGEDPLNLKYRLYAVVSHSGMMNGGHYVAYAHNPSGAWYCYNDSSCRELTPCSGPPPIDPSSAYMLFYERTGLDYEPYLPSTEGKQPVVSELELAEGEDSDLKKMCSIS